MKLFLILFTLLSATSLPQQKYFQIEKNNHGGFNIYANNNVMLYEFTKKNIDSASLSTLNDIFLKADKSKSDKQQVAVINLQEKGVDYSNIIIALASIISGLGGLWVGYIFNKKSQREQFRNQYKKEWLETFRTEATKLCVLLASPDTEKDSEKRLQIDKEIAERVAKFMLLLNLRKKIHSELFSLLQRKAISNQDISSDFERISRLLVQIMADEREDIL